MLLYPSFEQMQNCFFYYLQCFKCISFFLKHTYSSKYLNIVRIQFRVTDYKKIKTTTYDILWQVSCANTNYLVLLPQFILCRATINHGDDYFYFDTKKAFLWHKIGVLSFCGWVMPHKNEITWFWEQLDDSFCVTFFLMNYVSTMKDWWNK